MRHRRAYRKLGRPTQQRVALLRALAAALLRHGKVTTTEAKAKELRPFVEKLVSKAREDTLHRRRLVLAKVPDETAVRRLFAEIGPKYKERRGGYTRIVKLPPRQGDAARMALIEFVE